VFHLIGRAAQAHRRVVVLCDGLGLAAGRVRITDPADVRVERARRVHRGRAAVREPAAGVVIPFRMRSYIPSPFDLDDPAFVLIPSPWLSSRTSLDISFQEW